MEDGLSGTFAIIWFQIAIMVLFAKEFLPNDMSWVWRQFLEKKKKKETPEEIEARRKADSEKNLREAVKRSIRYYEEGRRPPQRSRWRGW